ncbi:curli assembly protein CsgF [Hymenobacter sp. 5516J-16]|uniref:curli assembly protein CsgF n=1 Tax=Hymenobacter sp. 5516J-16 TaxID=2932253 RepID=UPI001FD1A840|nr:curli assembly protein CsgF [Hymenobacter sp. 5516J-16]UOQ77826.1 curli assembly protein CsgF [Hymenobacter sp. 5516J-16]
MTQYLLRVALVVTLALGAHCATGQDLVYEPKNPSFGVATRLTTPGCSARRKPRIPLMTRRLP